MAFKNFKSRNGLDVDSYTLPNSVIQSKLTTNNVTTIDTIALDSFISCEYLITIKQGSKIRSSKLVVQTNGTTVDSTEFAITETGGSLSGVAITTAVVSSNAVVKAVVTDAGSTVALIQMSRNINIPRVTTTPDAPTIGTATAITGGATISFTAPVDNGGSEITSYTVISNPGNISETASSSPITILGLTDGTDYVFNVRATNSIGYGALSSDSNSIQPITPPSVSGGTLSSDSSYFYRTFLSSGTLNVSGAPVQIEVLAVAGGGGSGGGGGGAGGLVNQSATSFSTGNYTVTVGAGGVNMDIGHTNGSDTTISSITCIGGGKGGNKYGDGASSGGSGGGSMSGASFQYYQSSGNEGGGANGTVGQGNAGGAGTSNGGGGGGGAGAPGTQTAYSSGNVNLGFGGDGLEFADWATATSTGDDGYYAGGGIGGNWGWGNTGSGYVNYNPYNNTYHIPAGGKGGGGTLRGELGSYTRGTTGMANTGGGGGALPDAYWDPYPTNLVRTGNGGSGIVIVRYLKSEVGL